MAILSLLTLVTVFTLMMVSVIKPVDKNPFKLKMVYIFYNDVEDSYTAGSDLWDCLPGYLYEERILVRHYRDGSFEEVR